MEDWKALAPRYRVAESASAAAVTLGRYCNLLARYRELERFVSSGGAGGCTIVRRDKSGVVLSVRELPQAAELRWVIGALLAHEHALARRGRNQV